MIKKAATHTYSNVLCILLRIYVVYQLKGNILRKKSYLFPTLLLRLIKFLTLDSELVGCNCAQNESLNLNHSVALPLGFGWKLTDPGGALQNQVVDVAHWDPPRLSTVNEIEAVFVPARNGGSFTCQATDASVRVYAV